MYTIKHEQNHYAVYKDGIFYCSADTRAEAENEIKEEEYEKETYSRHIRDSDGAEYVCL